MRDPAADRYEAPCPDCRGTGREAGSADERHPEACRRCDGEASCEVRPEEIVTVGCWTCLGHGYGPRTGRRCPDCDGDGEITGRAEDVCAR